MNITFYSNNDDNNVVNKSLTNAVNTTGTVRDIINVTNPVIEVNTNIINFNYCFIPQFSRYYYIDKIEKVNTQLTLIYCKVDVLMSHSIYIRNLTAIVSRQKNNYNGYITDDKIVTLSYPRIQTKLFSNSFDKSCTYVLTVAGG